MPRPSDDNDSTRALWWNYFLSALILVLLFVTDWYFENKVLSETLVGILVGAPLGWIAAMNAYYFPSARQANGNAQRAPPNTGKEAK